MRRLVPMVLVAIITLIGAVVSTPALTASASELRNPPTVPGALYGVPMTGLPACLGTEASFPAAGGWLATRQYTSTGAGYPSTVSGYTTPRVVTLGEVCNTATGTNSIDGRIRVPWKLDGLTYTQAGSANPADFVLGCSSSTSGALPTCTNAQQSIRCGTGEWTAPTAVVTRNYNPNSEVNLGGYPGNATFPIISSTGATVAVGSFTGCSHLIEVNLRVCRWSSNLDTDFTCYVARWTAENQFNARPYSEADPERVLCELDPNYADCAFILEGVDGTDFNVVCAFPPVWDGDFLHFSDWLVLMIGHYGRCLFEPVNGWDREGTAQNSYDLKMGPILDSLDTLVFSWMGLYEGCGVISNIDILGQPLVLDTCTVSWTHPIREGWRWITIVSTALLLVTAVLMLFTNVVNRRLPAPEPIAGAASRGDD